MYQAKFPKDLRCPLEYGLSLFGGKWKSRIICVLALRGMLRYGQLREEIPNITDAVLSQNLKELIANEVIARRQFEEIPPRVEYSLTDKGQSVVPILREICKWAEAWYVPDENSYSPPCKWCDIFRKQIKSQNDL